MQHKKSEHQKTHFNGTVQRSEQNSFMEQQYECTVCKMLCPRYISLTDAHVYSQQGKSYLQTVWEII